jgi:crossover junction endodeoxyribonuclease RusA
LTRERILLRAFVPGVPRPQGSKSVAVDERTGRARLYEQSKYLSGWRRDVGAIAIMNRTGLAKAGTSVAVIARFAFPAKKQLSLMSTPAHVKPPDVDKLLRAVFDALTGIVWDDDAQVTKVEATKCFAGEPGVWLEVRAL